MGPAIFGRAFPFLIVIIRAIVADGIDANNNTNFHFLTIQFLCMKKRDFIIELSQDDISLRIDFSSQKKVTTSRIAGTVANEAIRILELYRTMQCKSAFKFHKAFRVKFIAERAIVFDSAKSLTGLMGYELTQKLKVMNNERSKRNFARNIYVFMMAMGQMVEFREAVDVINQCEKAIELTAAQAN